MRRGVVELLAGIAVVAWLVGSGIAAYGTAAPADAADDPAPSSTTTTAAPAADGPDWVAVWDGLVLTTAEPTTECSKESKRIVIDSAADVHQVCLADWTPSVDDVQSRCGGAIPQVTSDPGGVCVFEDRTGSVLNGSSGPLRVVYVAPKCIRQGGLFDRGGNVSGCRAYGS